MLHFWEGNIKGAKTKPVERHTQIMSIHFILLVSKSFSSISFAASDMMKRRNISLQRGKNWACGTPHPTKIGFNFPNFNKTTFCPCSDRYKVFIDLFHLSNFLVPREYIPVLTRDMKTVLRQVNNQCESDSAHYSDSENEELGLMGLSIDSQNNYISSSNEKTCVAENASKR